MKLIYFSLLILLSSSSCQESKYLPAKINSEEKIIDNTIPEDTAIANFIKPYAQHINKTLDSVLAYNPQILEKQKGTQNTAIGNMMADLVMEQANPIFHSRTGKSIDFVLLNYGGIRSSIGKGNITSRTAYELMPFENEIVIAELSGEKVQELLHYLETSKEAHPVSGIKIKMDTGYLISEVSINGKPIDPDKNYYVATSDYLQKGGDHMDFFKDPVHLYTVDYKLRNAIIDYFSRSDTIHAEIDDRFIKSN